MISADPLWDVERPLSATPEAATLRQVRKFIFKNALWLAGGLAAGVLLGVAAQNHLPPSYEAEGRFVVNELPFLPNVPQNNGSAGNDLRGDLMQSLVMSVASSSMRREMAARLRVDEKRLCFEELSGRPLPLRGEESVANIRVSSVHNSRTGTVNVRSQSAEFAAAVANAMLDELSNYNLTQGRLNALDMQRQIATTRSESIGVQLAGVKQSRDWQEQQVAQLDEYVRKGMPLESFPDFVSDTTLNNLKTERLLNQAEYTGLASSSSGGLQLEGKKAQVDDINKGVQNQAQSLAQGLRAQLAGTTTQKRNLEDELAQELREIQQCSHKREEWVQSFGDITMMKEMLARTTEGPAQSGAVIIVVNRAIPPERPKSPKLWLNLLVGVCVCGVAGLFVSIARTLFDDRIESPLSVATLTNLPCVTTTRPAGIFSRKIKNAPPREPGFNPLRNRMLLDAPEANLQIFGFTPARKREHASRTVADLALMLAGSGRRILVVDLNFSRPRQYKLLGIKPQYDLAEWMMSDRPIEGYIWPTELPELALLSWLPHKRPPTPELMLRRPLAKVLPDLRKAWDFIFIDAPPISCSWELMLTLPAGNPVVITARRGRTRASHVSLTASLAQSHAWNVAGVALQGC